MISKPSLVDFVSKAEAVSNAARNIETHESTGFLSGYGNRLSGYPQLTVMDYNMPDLDGLKAARQILAGNPGALILMVSVFASSQLADEAQRAGIKGVCSKAEGDCIIEAIETLLRGKTYFSKVALKPPPYLY